MTSRKKPGVAFWATVVLVVLRFWRLGQAPPNFDVGLSR